MLKIHSFLQRIKNFLVNILPNCKENFKIYMAVIAYSLITVVILMSPTYIYGLESSHVNTVSSSIDLANNLNDSEETANEAIIRVKQPSKELSTILYTYAQSLSRTENKNITNLLLTSNKELTRQMYANEMQMAENGALNKSEDIDDVSLKETEAVVETMNKTRMADEKDNLETAKADSINNRADAEKTVESSSTVKEKQTIAQVKYVVNLSKNEVEILQRIVEAEATGEDIKGKMLVANVILNRVNDDYFPDTVEAVVFQKNGNTYQFSPIKDKRYWSVTISDETKEAVDRVLKGEDSSQGALYFSARKRAEKVSMSWFDSNLKFLYKHGGHEFFKNK